MDTDEFHVESETCIQRLDQRMRVVREKTDIGQPLQKQHKRKPRNWFMRLIQPRSNNHAIQGNNHAVDGTAV